MNPTQVLLLAFVIGVVSGLRSVTAPAIVAWAAHRGWLNLGNSPLAFLGSTAAVTALVALAVVELIGDKLPSTPARTAAVGLSARIILGGLSGASVAVAGGQPAVIGAVFGVAGSVGGAFGGYQARTRLVTALRVPDMVIALLEDAAAIAVGFFVVSRFPL